MRCTREQFNVIIDLIKDNPVFHGKNSEKQFSVYFQLALVMYRLGSNGSGASIARIATLFGIGDGGTIDKITWRVFKCILAWEDEYIKWPSAEEKVDIIFETSDELPHCIGYVDGVEIPLDYIPSEHPVEFFSRKRQYSIKMQAVGDYKRFIRHVVIGWPGSAHDARIFNESKLATSPDEFFSGMEWLAGDCAYPLSTTLITPFRSNSNTLTPQQRAKFNQYFSSKRVRIEHIFGIMKNIFTSLQLLRLYLTADTHQFACTWIRVCCILYNILRPHLDEDDLNTGNQPNHEEEDEDDEGLLQEPNDLGEAKRIALYDTIYQENV